MTALSETALGMALVRAHESRRPDRLFDDPFAQLFVDAAPETFSGETRRAQRSPELMSLGAEFELHGALRTRFFDDYLVAACVEGCRQIALLAAGLDARAFRLQWPPGVRVFEVDLPGVLDFKERVLRRHRATPAAERIPVAADLRTEWPRGLIDAGLDATQRTAWLVEGLLLYLTRPEAERLFTSITTQSALHSHLACENSGDIRELQERAGRAPGMDRFTSLWKGGLGDDAPEFLRARGWSIVLHDGASVAASYGRAAPAPSAGSISGGMLTGLRGS